MVQANSVFERVRIPKDKLGQYLRTGEWTATDGSVEVKFNPWHDLVTGRFTYKGGGNSGKTGKTWGVRGFTGGGGGASASWTDGFARDGKGSGPKQSERQAPWQVMRWSGP